MPSCPRPAPCTGLCQCQRLQRLWLLAHGASAWCALGCSWEAKKVLSGKRAWCTSQTHALGLALILTTCTRVSCVPAEPFPHSPALEEELLQTCSAAEIFGFVICGGRKSLSTVAYSFGGSKNCQFWCPKSIGPHTLCFWCDSLFSAGGTNSPGTPGNCTSRLGGLGKASCLDDHKMQQYYSKIPGELAGCSAQALVCVSKDAGTVLPDFQLEPKPGCSPEPVTQAWINPT